MFHIDTSSNLVQRSWLWSLAVRAAIVYIACLPFWTYPLGFGTPFHGVLQQGTFWLHDHVFQVVGFDFSRLSNPDVGSKVEMALAGALLWLLLDHRRRHEPALFEILCVATRYALGGVLIGIGLIKVFPIQMNSPDPLQLMQPIGQPDGMWPAWGLMAKSVGASAIYQMYTGWLEVASGSMLFFRRTATLGALLVLIEVTVIIAMSSDTADFRNSANFNWIAGSQLPAALILAATGWRPVVDFFVLNRPTGPVPQPALTWLRQFEVGLRIVFFIAMLFCLYRTVLTWHDRRFHSPIAGVYAVERFTRNGQSSFTGPDAARRWRMVAIHDCSRIAVRTIDDTPLEFTVVFPVKVETRFRRDCVAATTSHQGTLILAGPPSPSVVQYVRTAPDRLDLEGVFEGANINAHMRRIGDDRFALLRVAQP